MKSKISSFFEKNVGKLALSGIVFALALVVALTTAFVLNGKKLENKTTPPTNAETTILPNNSDKWTDAGNYDTVNISTGAGFNDGNGTETDPYIISTARQLAGLAKLASTGGTKTYKYYKLGGNIDLLEHYWTPIGTNDTYYFNGSFDGGGFVISGMVVRGSFSCAGLFGYMKGESGQTLKISNLEIENSEINVTTSSDACAGGLIGLCANALIIDKCYNGGVINIISFEDSVAGGLVGYATATIDINNAYNYGVVSTKSNGSTASSCWAGGVVGFSPSLNITNIFNKGSVSATSVSANISSLAGGLAGASFSLIISNCYNNGEVNVFGESDVADSGAGGLIGYVNSELIIKNCINVSKVKTESNLLYKGGLVGGISASCSSTIKNSYFDGDVFSGNMIGNGSATITASGKVSGLSGKMKEKTNYGVSSFGTYTDDNSLTGNAVWTEAWDFAEVWMIEQGFNFEYPIFKTMEDKMWKYDDNVLAITGFSKGLGTAESPYKISSAEELGYLSILANQGNTKTYKYYELTADIDLSGKYWTPIGTGSTNYFNGSFDGNGYVISGMTIDMKSSSVVYAGLFGYMKGGTGQTLKVSNIGIENSEINVTSSSAWAGGLVGCSSSTLTITNSYNTGNVSVTSSSSPSSSNAYAGGLVGNYSYFSSSTLTITNSYNTGSISAESISYFAHAGGFVGTCSSLMIESSYNTGSVSAESTSSYARTGGFVGTSSSSLTIESSFNCGKIFANGSITYLGGVVGRIITGTVTINNTFCTGDIQSLTGSGNYIKSFVGDGSTSITNSYYNLDMLNSSGGVVSSEKGYYSKGASDTVAFDGNIWFYHSDLNEGLPLLRSLFWAEASIAKQSDVLNIFTNKGFNLVV